MLVIIFILCFHVLNYGKLTRIYEIAGSNDVYTESATLELEGFDGDNTYSALDDSTDFSYSTNQDYETPSGSEDDDENNYGKAYDIQTSCDK